MKFDPLHQMFSAAGGAGPDPHAALTAALVAELGDAVPVAQRRGFYLAVGRRLAAAETLDGVDDAAQLGKRVNAFWHGLGWGQAELRVEADAIVVRHDGVPLAPGDTPTGPWLGMLLAVLEGAYDSWFRRLGSGPSLQTHAQWKGDTVELRHGR